MKTPYDAAGRWKKQILDMLRRDLAQLFQKHDALAAQINAMEMQLHTEQQVMHHNPLYDFAAFATRSRTERTLLEAKRVDLERAIHSLQAQITEAFQDFKGLDVARERFIAAERQAEAMRETAALDEIALQRHIRQAHNDSTNTKQNPPQRPAR